MGINLDTPLKPSKTRISRNVSYGLTALGKSEVDEGSFEGGSVWNLLSTLDDGPLKLSQISKEMKVDQAKTKLLLIRAIREGFIRPVSSE